MGLKDKRTFNLSDAATAATYVSWHTAPSEDGAYIPMTEEEATKSFFDWLDSVRADAWDEGARALSLSYTSEWPDNPYRMDGS